jgi:ribosomal-protein-alanine N-acetyltransferase
MDKKAIRFEKQHAKGAARLERLCFSEPWSEKSLLLLASSDAVGFVVTENDTVLAYGGMMTVLDEGQITNIAVDPCHRRKGFGTDIVHALIGYAQENGIVSISLEVRESNAAAIALYGSLGFVRCGLRKNFYRAPVESAIIMVWKKERT